MNCKNCNSPLELETRFCPQCGTPSTGNPIISGVDQTIQATPLIPRSIEAESTLITPQESMKPTTDFQPFSQEIEKTQQAQWSQPIQQIQQTQWSQPDSYFQPGGSQPDSSLQPEGLLPQSQQASSYISPNLPFPLALTEPLVEDDANQKSVPSKTRTAMNTQKDRPRARRSLGGCVLRLITVLVLLLTLLVGAWFFALRPYVHGITENELNNAMNRTVNQIPPIASVIPLPPHTPLPPITETGLQNLIMLNISPANPVQNLVVHITQQGVRMEFTVHENFLIDFNFPSAVSFLPALDEQGNLVARNVSVEGIASLVMSSDEMSSLLNQHFSDAMKRLNRSISSITLEHGQINITLN